MREYSAEEWGQGKDKARDLVDSVVESAIKKAIHIIIDNLTRFDDSGLWSKAYKAFYAPHIEIMVKLLSTELRYDHQWTQITQLRHLVDCYTDDLRRLLGQLPPVPSAPVQQTVGTVNLFEVLDAGIRGTLNVIVSVTQKIKSVNEYLQIYRPKNVFDFVIGQNGNFTARNGLCDSARSLISVVERMADYRNSWSRACGVPISRSEFRLGIQQECTDTRF